MSAAAEQEPEQYIPQPHLTEEQQAVIVAKGIPVDSDYPGRAWIACVGYESVMPTDAELAMIRSYIEYAVQNTYNERYQALIFAKPLPAEAGHVTKIFRKGARWLHQENPKEGWVYRASTWDSGTWPQWPEPRVSLIEILDRMHTATWNTPTNLYTSWVEWKAQRPETFGVL